eukprot:TRINITY_DN105784_c0_g1_i1.p1 TRINITY_DN105784_c0_g1~~TRINITY_DN105784_c0_g1_i1.p1  ORF type:complete len:629 (-),score=61.91 TRINITY_DN105784_c0_g1_i1:243-2129(-)
MQCASSTDMVEEFDSSFSADHAASTTVGGATDNRLVVTPSPLSIPERFESILSGKRQTLVTTITEAFQRFVRELSQAEERAVRDLSEVERVLNAKGEKLEEERRQLHLEQQGLQNERDRMQSVHNSQMNKIRVNVGGHKFETSLATLTAERGSMLEAMFSGRFPTEYDNNEYFIDRDAECFPFILNYLRDGDIDIPKDKQVRGRLLREATFYGLDGLQHLLDKVDHGGEENNSHFSPHPPAAKKDPVAAWGGRNSSAARLPACSTSTTYSNRPTITHMQTVSYPGPITTTTVTSLASLGEDTPPSETIVATNSLPPIGMSNSGSSMHLSNSSRHQVWWDGDIHEVHTLKGHTHYVLCLQFNLQTMTLITGSGDNNVRVWDMDTGTCTKILYGHTGFVCCLQFEDNLLVTGSKDTKMMLWDITKGKRVQNGIFEGHTSDVQTLHMGGNVVVSGSADHTIRTWDIAKRSCTAILRGHTARVTHVQFHGDRLVSGSSDRTVRVWAISSRQCVAVLTGHTDSVFCLQFEGNRLVTGSSDKTIRLWDLATNDCVAVLEGHTGWVKCLQFKGTQLLSGGDKTIKIWDLDKLACVKTVTTTHTNDVRCLMFQGRYLVSGSFDGSIKVWRQGKPEF